LTKKPRLENPNGAFFIGRRVRGEHGCSPGQRNGSTLFFDLKHAIAAGINHGRL